MIYQFTDVVFPPKGNQDHDLVSYNIGLPQLQLMMATHAQLSGTAEPYFVLGPGAGANKQAPESLTCRGSGGILRQKSLKS